MQKSYNKYNKREANESSIKEVFSKFVETFCIDCNPFEHEILEVWQKITGSLTTRLTKRIYIQGSMLYVYISSPVLKHELMLVRTDLLDKINKHFADKYKQFANKNILNNIIIK
ncbi:MAG: DUF721 domain-containing protein [Bacteroidales bacterium]|jgi:hypothetical protein|nr:DUF721 domain-containing protein [Bacteroidales bacterium]